MSTERLRHGKVELALHGLREGAGRALLLLHGLAQRSPTSLPAALAAWPGPVHALDFTGHGESSVPVGGGYHPEVLMADADTALRHLGEATLVGRGLGAYVALLLAGARPRAVRGAILCDGPGLRGGGPAAAAPTLARVDPGDGSAPDPFALVELARDARPPDYAAVYLQQARALSGLSRPVSVCARERPEWLAALLEAPGAAEADLAGALALYAEAP